LGNLQKYFYDANSPEALNSSGVFKPAAAFEMRNNITGIAGYYEFPNGMNPTEYEIYFRDKFIDGYLQSSEKIEEVKEEWNAIKSLNTELSDVNVDTNNFKSVWSATMGAISLFNIDDINCFLDSGKKFGTQIVENLNSNEEYRSLDNYINMNALSSMGWVASLNTLKLIREKLDEKKINPAIKFDPK